MKRILVYALIAVGALQSAPKKPKLVLAIVIDQFRYDYLTRFRGEYHSGFERLLTKGAVFTNARYQHFPTVTAIGHSTFLSGATPSISGIIGNEWYERDEQRQVTSVNDPATEVLGGSGAQGSSPRRLLVSTVGDEVKMAGRGESRVIGISLKDRAAILPAGHMADGAYWFDNVTGNFVTSTFYAADLPAWVKAFNQARPGDRYQGAKWLDRVMPSDPRKLYNALAATPFSNELIESFAERAIEAEQLGKHPAPDVLCVSFSGNDYVGHEAGPDSPEVHDISVRTDGLLEKLFQAVDRQVGLDNVLVVLTADHGVAPLPELNAKRKMPGGRMRPNILAETIQDALSKKYGKFDWITGSLDGSIYLNQELIAVKKLDRSEVTRTAAAAALEIPHIMRVFTRDDLMHGAMLADPVAHSVMNGYYERRGADVEVLLEPYWIFSQTGATHGAPFGYDSHVPVIFMGPGVRAGRYDNSIVVNDIAPTLATMLEVETPSGSVGRVLTEIIEQ